MSTLFGTDGIRANITEPIMAPENFCRLGRILGTIIQDSDSTNTSLDTNQISCSSKNKFQVSIGRDTRASGSYLESALVAGLNSMGIDCELLGVLPTSAISYCAQLSQSSLALVISASHNPSCDNGLKIFGPDGFKISSHLENHVNNLFSQIIKTPNLTPGKTYYNKSADYDYLNMLAGFVKPANNLAKFKLVVDCANGAASNLALKIFSELGCELKIIGASPDGDNINRGFGSESPGKLKSEVLNFKADLGIAFDGDADRVIFVDEKANLIDGDAVLATFAIYLNNQGLLAKNILVSTIMSSQSLDQALASHGISVVRSSVGDKQVAKAMLDGGFSFGGENSGHLINFPHTHTGDGLLSALQFLNILSEAGKTASELTSFYRACPSLLKNISVQDKIPLCELPKTQVLISQANHNLAKSGRVMLRYSGTENKARLLVEAKSQEECQEIADIISSEFCLEIAAKLQNQL